MRGHRQPRYPSVPRDLYSPLAEKETFSQRDFWRRFERVIARELSDAHAQGARGIRRAGSLGGCEVGQPGHDADTAVPADVLRDIALRTKARWVACLTETRIRLVHGLDIELESELVDGAWYHCWHRRAPC